MFKEFREFINRGNVMDLAVAVILAAAFGKIVTTLVENVIMPPVGMLLGKVDFASLFLTLDSSKGVPLKGHARLARRRQSQRHPGHSLRAAYQRPR